MTSTALPSSIGTGLMYPRTKSDPAWALWAETLAPYEALLHSFEERSNPTCRDTISQWSRDANPGGFSAKMFLHLTCSTLHPHWSCSDTTALLSRQTVPRLRVRAGVVSLWQDSISKTPLIGLCESALSPKVIQGAAKRACQKYGQSYSVLVRDGTEWIIVLITCGKVPKKGYAFSHTLSGSLFKDSLLDGLCTELTRMANESQSLIPPENESSATPSPSPSPSGSASG